MSGSISADGKLCILVLGMHRSGTSALTRAVNLLGATIPNDLFKPDLHNQAGYWEPRALVQLDDLMLDEAGSRWDDWRPFGPSSLPQERLHHYADRIAQLVTEEMRHTQLLVLKDPRMCRFVWLYQRVMKDLGVELRYLLALRHPSSVEASLARRNRFTDRFGALLWLRHTLEAEYATRGNRRLVVSYEDLMNDLRPTLERVGDLCGIRQAVDERADAIDAFFSADFRHHLAQEETLPRQGKLVEWVKDAYDAMLALKGDPNDVRATAVLDRVRARLDVSEGEIGDVVFAEMQRRRRVAREEEIRLQKEIAELKKALAGAAAEARHGAETARQRDVWREAAARSAQESERLEGMLRGSRLARLGVALSVSRRAGHARMAKRAGGILTREGPAGLLKRIRTVVAAEVAGDRRAARGSDRGMKLSFIIGGVQKAGTTALFEYLSRHPDLSPPSRKELHFFDNEAIDWDAPDYDKLHSAFQGSGIRFEATPIYLFWPRSIQRIVDYRPDIRLIFTFRDPIERAFSHWCMEFARGAESLTFQDAIRTGRARLTGEPRSEADRRWSYVERGYYGRQVSNLLSLVPLSQTLFLRSEDIELSPAATLDRISQFLGIRRAGPVQAVRAHERPRMAYPSVLEAGDIALLRDEYRADIELFSATTGLDVASWLTMRRV